jgi:nitronate monooxygenase
MAILDELSVPVVLAPLAGGPSTPELAAAVSGSGGLGFLASGYLSADQTRERIGALRALTDKPFGVNVFVPGRGPTDPAVYEPYLKRLSDWAEPRGLQLGEPRYSDDDWKAKLELLQGDPVPVVSFTFGCPDREVITSLRSGGSEVWVTVTGPNEARQATGRGAEVLVAQGAEAGGHRASFIDAPDAPVYSLLTLLGLVRAATDTPLVATGGIATGEALAAVLAAGARAGQIGTGFMLSPEAGTNAAHRAALATGRPTALTRSFTGRLARGIVNRFMDAHGELAPVAYPELHYITAPMRQRARQDGEGELLNLWAGEAHQLAQERPTAEIVKRLGADAREALRAASRRITSSPLGR